MHASSTKPAIGRPHVIVALLLLAALTQDPAWALERGRTLQDRAYAAGGVGETEQLELQAQRPAYSLWIITAAMRSGEYLSDVRLSIRDVLGQQVFEGRLDGPWLLIDLAPGRYVVEASWHGQTQRNTTTIHAGDRHQLIAYFKTAGE